MEQQGIMVFEKGLDEFLSDLKLRLTRSESVHVTSQSMPQCLQSLKVIDESQRECYLRLVVIGCNDSMLLARLSWLDDSGKDHVCCYLNGQFEAVRRKANGLWVREKQTPKEVCLQKWGALRSPI